MTIQQYWTLIQTRISGFYNNNRKVLTYAGSGFIIALGLIIFWTMYWHPKREKEAGMKLAKLHHYFEKDSFDVVLNGIKGKKMATAPQIADAYGWTVKGREAALMAGLSYLRTGKYQKAIDYLNKTKVNDMILGPTIESAKAGCYAELGKLEKAAEFYEKAGEMGKNDFTAQFYKQAGKHYEMAKEYKDALRCYQKIKSFYGSTAEASDIDKYIFKVKGLLGELNK